MDFKLFALKEAITSLGMRTVGALLFPCMLEKLLDQGSSSKFLKILNSINQICLFVELFRNSENSLAFLFLASSSGKFYSPPVTLYTLVPPECVARKRIATRHSKMDLAIKVANVNKKYRLGTINWHMIKKGYSYK